MRKLLCVLGMLLIVCSLAIGQKSLRVDARGNYYTEVKTKVADQLTGKTFTDALGERFPLYVTANNKLYYLKASATTGNIGKHYIKMPEEEVVTNRAYSIKVVDEHEVQLTRGTNTIILYFENATVLSEEKQVFVDFKTN